jgi:hypothetical protein
VPPPTAESGPAGLSLAEPRARVCCLIECDKPHEALGLCKGHYVRQRKYGDPRAVGRIGPEASTPEVFAKRGLTYRQIRYWCGKGLIDAPIDPARKVRRWHPDEVRVALLIHGLSSEGLPLNMAARIARDQVGGTTEHQLGPGVLLLVDEPREVA